MTAETLTPQPDTADFGSKPGFGRLLLSEWTKIRSVRSTIWSLVLLVVLTFSFTVLFMALTVAQWSKSDPSQKAAIALDPTGAILGSGFFFGQLTICVLGVMVMSSEYSTGMIRASLLAVPKRVPMLAAKGVVFALLVFVVGEVVSFGSFFIGAPILNSKVHVALGDHNVLRAVIGGGLYLSVLSLFALAIGGIVRHTAAAITGVIGFIIVLSPLAQLLPGTIGKHIYSYLPSQAGQVIAKQHPAKADLLGPWQGFGVFLLWTALLLVIAGVLLARRDA